MAVKSDLVDYLYETGVTRREAKSIVDLIMDQIFSRLVEGETVQITNFGRFEIRTRDPHTMTNPNTGEQHEISERQVVHFTPSKSFRERFQ